jgi:hypothetical protein
MTKEEQVVLEQIALIRRQGDIELLERLLEQTVGMPMTIDQFERCVRERAKYEAN